jgi:hypothetical protein
LAHRHAWLAVHTELHPCLSLCNRTYTSVNAAVCRFLGECVKTHPPENRIKLNKGGFPMRPGRPICPAYLRTAFCPLMKACMQHHPNLRFLPQAAGADSAGAPTAANTEASPRPIPQGPGHSGAKAVKQGHLSFEVIETEWQRHFPQNPTKPRCKQFMEFGACECGFLAASLPPAFVHRFCCALRAPALFLLRMGAGELVLLLG